MHILYLHQYFSTPERGGSIRSYEISKALIKRGHKISIISSYHCFGNLEKKKIKFKKINGINVHFIDSSFFGIEINNKILSFIYFSIFSTFKALTVKADVVYATSTPLTIAIPALLKRFIQKTPFIFEVRDLWPDIPIQRKILNNFFLIKFSLLLEFLAYKYALKIIVIVEGFKKHLIKYKKIKPNKIIIITQFCYDYNFKIDSKTCKFFRKNKKYLLYAGSIDHNYNVEFLVYLLNKIYFKYPNIVFLVFGDGSHYDNVKKLAKSYSFLDKNFFLFKSVNRKKLFEISKYVVAHFALANKSLPKLHLKNNANNKFFFALNCNKPIINNFSSWQTNIAKKYNTGIEMNGKDYDLASKQLIYFLDNVNFFSKKKNFEYLKKKFNINTYINLLEKNLVITN